MAGGMQGGYPPPVPMRRPGNNGLLLWSLVGCGVIALLVVIICGVTLTKGLKGFGAKGMISVMAEVNPTAARVQKVAVGLEAYQKDHNGHYPPTLEALVPKYVTDKSDLVCGESESPKPMEYTLPKSTAAESDVVISVHVGDITMNLPENISQVQKIYVCLLKNGQVVSDEHVRSSIPKYSAGSPEHKRTY